MSRTPPPTHDAFDTYLHTLDSSLYVFATKNISHLLRHGIAHLIGVPGWQGAWLCILSWSKLEHRPQKAVAHCHWKHEI